ncbi:MAG: MazG nucleotide pyrophosphohydrolase domain-containing protein [Candidatus Omnitrophica bacterium]|nr:MazG nucleotide pyrophosphohydrolase domain-containing protein [Candidatus Omnitrophota bacterium]MDD5080789.1 MazG nucleotide pyrophosphohydrolase domain-containing protein [Candidatus Omnitrophota bacterium]MDD5440906.1 MazG nucleotide pyrophosphohydrolase domain-containing protein [Candidatus Omnitrophota bacterium]
MKEFDGLYKIIVKLRSPKGCPWDRAQKINDYKKYLLEETYELIDAIDKSDNEEVCEEIGDILIVLMSMCYLYQEKKKFSIKDVLKAVNNKLVTRHPHVFAGKKVKDKTDVLKNWIKDKAKVKKRVFIKDRLPNAVPSLLLASIFLKEKKHALGSFKDKTFENEIINEIISAVPGFSGSKKNTFKKVLMSLSELAYIHKIDLEELLRQEILYKSKKIKYRQKLEDE